MIMMDLTEVRSSLTPNIAQAGVNSPSRGAVIAGSAVVSNLDRALCCESDAIAVGNITQCLKYSAKSEHKMSAV
jgi:hypothetical protein